MSTDLVFDFGGKRVRTAGTFEAPLFAAADVCAVLGIENVGNALARLDADEQENIRTTDAMGKTRPIVHVTLSGLFALILRSKKREAKEFRKWVTSEVLPAIQRRGYYSFAEAQTAQQTERLLAEIFPKLPGRAAPIFRELIASLLRLRREQDTSGNPPWARSLASMVYGWALPVAGQQTFRRTRNAKHNGSNVDYSMLSELALERVKRIAQSGCEIARISNNWEMWKLNMELAHGKKATQLPFMVSLAALFPPIGGKRVS